LFTPPKKWLQSTQIGFAWPAKHQFFIANECSQKLIYKSSNGLLICCKLLVLTILASFNEKKVN